MTNNTKVMLFVYSNTGINCYTFGTDGSYKIPVADQVNDSSVYTAKKLLSGLLQASDNEYPEYCGKIEEGEITTDIFRVFLDPNRLVKDKRIVRVDATTFFTTNLSVAFLLANPDALFNVLIKIIP